MIHCNASHIASAAEPPVVRAYLPGDRRSIAGPAPTRKWARSQIRHISEPHPLWQAVPAELVASGAPLPEHLIGGIVALGNFDGFHIGHQAVVRKAVELARARGVCALVAAFDPHPVSYFRQGSAPFQLTSLRQRQRLFAQAGAAATLVFHFDENFAALSPEAFVRERLAPFGGVVVGDGFTFGAGRAGSNGMLSDLAAAEGLSLSVLPPIEDLETIVSSTRIRQALRTGVCVDAGRLLSRAFAMEGSFSASSTVAIFNPSCDYIRLSPGRYAGLLNVDNGREVDCVVIVEPGGADGGLRTNRCLLIGQHAISASGSGELHMLRRIGD